MDLSLLLRVMTDYGLAPETQYPVSLHQIVGVYKWVLCGGLGFVPTKISLFGESAGTDKILLLLALSLRD